MASAAIGNPLAAIKKRGHLGRSQAQVGIRNHERMLPDFFNQYQ
jgi:hypothetical protein